MTHHQQYENSEPSAYLSDIMTLVPPMSRQVGVGCGDVC